MSPPIKTQRDLHLARKTFHVTAVMVMFGSMAFFSEQVNGVLYAMICVPLVCLDYFRRFSPALNGFCLRWARLLVRRNEFCALTGGTYAIIGLGLVYFLFPQPIALLATLFLALGDPTASFFGLRYGKRKLGKHKSLEGSLAGVLVCTLATLGFAHWWPSPLMGGNQGWVSLLCLSLGCGLIGGVSELYTPFGWDDNLSQPLISGGLLSLLFCLMGGGFDV